MGKTKVQDEKALIDATMKMVKDMVAQSEEGEGRESYSFDAFMKRRMGEYGGNMPIQHSLFRVFLSLLGGMLKSVKGATNYHDLGIRDIDIVSAVNGMPPFEKRYFNTDIFILRHADGTVKEYGMLHGEGVFGQGAQQVAEDDLVDLSGGSSLALDTAMSDESENAVKNKVVKSYVDDAVRELNDLIAAINALLQGDNGDDLIETLQEALGFINEHKEEIDSLVNTYVKKVDVVDDLVTGDKAKVLSAAQGVVLKGLIDGLGNVYQTLAGDTKDNVTSFGYAVEREVIVTGENQSVLFGKIRKWLSDLQTVAFTGKTADLTADATHRFVTDAEKDGWSDKYTKTETDDKDAVILSSAKTYAGNIVSTLGADVYRKAETDNKDAAALQTAKEYAAQKIAEVVNGSPEALDTLQELAAALGNDPNFATSIMALIGGKADTVHSHAIANVTNLQGELNKKLTITQQYAGDVNTLTGSFIGKLYDAPNAPYNFYPFFSFGYDQYRAQFNAINNSLKFRSSNATNGALGQWVDIWHSGNLNPDSVHMANKQTLISNVNLNTLTTEGTYNFQTANGTGNVGIPEGVPMYGTLVVNNGGSFISQMYVTYVGIVLIRSRADNGTWSAWSQLATTGQLPTVFVQSTAPASGMKDGDIWVKP